MTEQIEAEAPAMTLFGALGFAWDRSAVPAGVATSVERATQRYERRLPQIVFDAAALEGNPLAFDEVRALLAGTTPVGRDPFDVQQVLNLAAAAGDLLSLVRSGAFRLDKPTSDRLHGLVAREEALEWGHFRGEGQNTGMTPRVSLGRGTFTPSHTTEPGAGNLRRLFGYAVTALDAQVHDPRERAMAVFLFGALQQFYFDGNKRTARFMMSGVLMAHGMDAISVPAARAQAFDEAMVRFYVGRDGTEMMGFLIDYQSRDDL